MVCPHLQQRERIEISINLHAHRSVNRSLSTWWRSPADWTIYEELSAPSRMHYSNDTTLRVCRSSIRDPTHPTHPNEPHRITYCNNLSHSQLWPAPRRIQRRTSRARHRFATTTTSARARTWYIQWDMRMRIWDWSFAVNRLARINIEWITRGASAATVNQKLDDRTSLVIWSLVFIWWGVSIV